ncbi:MAG: Lrp/AsnC family transcriptional regulator [archaeon GB-1867-097]|nr:Lrp/AsnC family transcriptional regulator [Candidatus Culexmicrobium thermophilum]MCS7384180.1 Lrp/AsnC family transcriptional regulator [Candidatus Culexmicrobium thermophilum]HDO20213.1 winged helix-turn-helix transcriptional regulator [Candidatus Bathyarchaeota archaeon]
MEWKECPSFRKYVKAIDEKCFKIIKAINEKKSKNLSLIARETGMPPALVHYYYDKLARRGIIKLKARINFKKMGLMPVEFTMKIEAQPEKLEEELRKLEYWRNIARYYTSSQVFYHCYFTIPEEIKDRFKEAIYKIAEETGSEITDINWTPIDLPPKSNFKWFNERRRRWEFKWEEWLKENIEVKETKLTLDLEEEEKVFLDEPDIFILKKLEENAEITFKELATALGVTPPTIRYHYYKHLVNYGVLVGYEPEVYPYPKDLSTNLLAEIRIVDKDKMKRFLETLNDKPFTHKIIVNPKENKATLYVYMIYDQVTNFIKALSKLKQMRTIDNYSVGMIDDKCKFEKTLPAELYEKGRWKKTI